MIKEVFYYFEGDLSCVPISHSYPLKNRNYKKYFFDDDDEIEVGFLKNSLATPPPYLELALNSFFESYNIEDERLRFVMLIICLERIFNIDGKYPKAKISKGVALIIYFHETTFYEEIEKIKSLYELRNFIVHGDNENIQKNKDYRKNLKAKSIPFRT